jgi:hypothetical protein
MQTQSVDIDAAREQVTKIVLSARTLSEIDAAKQVLRKWLKAHPEEQEMRDGFEQLYTIQEIIEEEDARRAAEQEHLVETLDIGPILLEPRSLSGASQ